MGRVRDGDVSFGARDRWGADWYGYGSGGGVDSRCRGNGEKYGHGDCEAGGDWEEWDVSSAGAFAGFVIDYGCTEEVSDGDD